MSDPLGFNPVAEHAPGLPRHDAPLPGHAPGEYTPMGGGDEPAPFTMQPMTYAPPTYFETVMGKWFGRVITFVFILLFLPIHLALYPIGGAVGLAAGYGYYTLAASPFVSRDEVLSSAWFVAFLAFLPMLRFENNIADRNPKYRAVRHWARLVLVAVWFYWFDVYEQGDNPGTAIIVGVICAAIMHFILRGSLTMGLWRALEHMSWLRSTD
jgi:hypothetical protein